MKDNRKTRPQNPLSALTMLESVGDGFAALDTEWRYIFVNEKAAQIFGRAREELIGKHIWSEFPERIDQPFYKACYRAVETQQPEYLEEYDPHGKHWFENRIFPSKDGLSILFQDITGRKQAEETLRENENQLKRLVENIPSAERKQAEDILKSRESYLTAIIENQPGLVWLKDKEGRFLAINKAFALACGRETPDEVIGKTDLDVWPKELAEKYRADDIEVMKQNKSLIVEELIVDQGETKWFKTFKTPIFDETGQVIGTTGYARDITERKRAENLLNTSERKYRLLFTNNPVPMWVYDVNSLAFLAVNDFAVDQYGYSREEFLGMTIKDIRPSGDLPHLYKTLKTYTGHLRKVGEARHRRKDGSLINVEITGHDIDFDGRPAMLVLAMDISERKQAEEALRLQSAALNAAANSIIITNLDGIIEWVNPAFTTFTGYSIEEAIGRNPRELVKSGKHDRAFYKNLWNTITSGQIWHGEIINRRKDGSFYNEEQIITPLKNTDGKISHFIAIKQDITARKQAGEEIRQRLSELEVLYQSGLAFSQFAHPKAIAEKIIQLLDQKMDWHHTAIRLYHVKSDSLELLAFNTPGLKSEAERSIMEERFKTSVARPGDGLSGWAIQHGEAVRSNNLKNDPRYTETFPGLQSGLYVPIKISGRVIGVISIESQIADAFSESDERLTTTLAAQAAIAFDNAELFVGLQHSNIELALAYDATIEGWSRALDLRDKETEGHTLRVAEKTLKLARVMRISESDLTHIRRGALLHDIGKMAIPDTILLKPGELTREEWAIMRLHPQLAYEMLFPITYLRPALDIPYCHHEKWDGSGYPRGLKDEQIPLVARIFAVVDVWDALTSNRPYRAAWADAQVSEYIKSQTGTHFDPAVAKVFLKSNSTGKHRRK